MVVLTFTEKQSEIGEPLIRVRIAYPSNQIEIMSYAMETLTDTRKASISLALALTRGVVLFARTVLIYF